MHEIERIRGEREAAYDWPAEDQEEIARLTAEGKVIAVDRDDNILSDCTADAVYATRGNDTDLTEVSAPILTGDCEGASDIISGFTLRDDGSLLALSFAQVEPTSSGPTMELLLTKTTIDPGEMQGRWTLHDESGSPLCDLPCVRWFMPESSHRAGFVQREDTDDHVLIPWDPLHPGTDVHLELTSARPNTLWPHTPIVEVVLGFGASTGAAVIISQSDYGGGTDAFIAPIVLGFLGLVSAVFGVHGSFWLFNPPDPEPAFRVKSAGR